MPAISGPAEVAEGLLDSVPGYASSISYHPNGLVHRVRHANGITWIEDNDPDDMARPARIRTSGASNELDTGVYAYDAAGNVTRTGADRYAYDLLSRIVDARLGQYVEACGGDLTLAGVTETAPRTWESCGTIHGGPDYTVASDVTLRAEGQVIFYSGFSVASGASLAVEAGAPVNDAPATPVDRAQSYGYDRFGNLLSMTTTEAGGGSTTRTFATDSSTNRLSSSLVLYDSSGNVTARQIAAGVWWDFDHDPFNMMREARPTSTTGYEYLYGPGDERIGVIDWTGSIAGNPSGWIETYTLRDLDGSPLRQYRVEGGNTSGHWSILRDYIWRGPSLLALETPSGVRHMHPDHLGSPRLITNATGATLAQHLYFPFGEEATDPTQDAEVTKFTVHERDFHLPDPPRMPTFPATLANVSDDLDYMHARYYSPHLGRFMSVDPAMESADPFLPQTWNRYTYVSSNPLKYLDPTGEILFFFGASSELQQVKDLANENLHGVDLVIDKNGKASLVPNNEAGPPSPQQEAFADNLSFAINAPQSVDIQVVSNDSGVVFGQYITSTIDVQDIAAVGPGQGVNSAALLAHEVMEQTTAQIAGLPFNRGGHQVAHPSGIRAQESVSGYRRLPPSVNLDAQNTGTIVGRHKRGNDLVTVTFRFVNGNLKQVTRRP